MPFLNLIPKLFAISRIWSPSKRALFEQTTSTHSHFLNFTLKMPQEDVCICAYMLPKHFHRKKFSPRSRQPVDSRKEISGNLRINHARLCSARKENAGNLRIKRGQRPKSRRERNDLALIGCYRGYFFGVFCNNPGISYGSSGFPQTSTMSLSFIL